jgi:gamma-glutamyltranspeptidase/glutathione hydrolase
MLGRPVVLGRSAAVSSGHWLASEAGLAVLRAGGNAIDAAVTTLAMLAVTKPDACGLGSDLFLQYYEAATGRVYALNASGPAPALANIDAFGGAIPTRGPRAVAVPGAVGGWAAALERFGTIDLARALAPAIAYARDGMPVSAHFASVLEAGRALLAADPGCADAFLPGGRAAAFGENFRQPDAAGTLEAIAGEGAAAFYRGSFARALDADMRARGGFLRASDMEGYEPQWLEPLHVRYRGYDVYEQPLVSQGVIVLEAAKIVEGFPLAEYGDRSADFVHLHTEAVKLAVQDRQRYLCDPAFGEAPVASLLDDAFIAERRRAIDPKRANANPVAGALLASAADTSYGCAVDAAGNGVSFIQSVFEVWGSAYAVPGTGVLLNNRMTAFSLDPQHVNALVPGKRTMHTLNTVVVCKDGKLRWVFGTPGAPAQVQSNTQLLTRVVDFGLNPQEAIEAPRAFWPGGGDLMVESRFGAATLAELARRGHRVGDLGDFHLIVGGMEMIHVNEHGIREAAADPRREGYAVAY